MNVLNKSRLSSVNYGICSDDDILFDETGPVGAIGDDDNPTLSPYLDRLFCTGKDDYETKGGDHHLGKLGSRVGGLDYHWTPLSAVLYAYEEGNTMRPPRQRKQLSGGDTDDQLVQESKSIVNEGSFLGCFRVLFKFKYTILYEIYPQLLWQMFITGLAQAASQTYLKNSRFEIPHDWTSAFEIFLAIVGFFLVIRADQAYTHFIEGGENMDQMVATMCSLSQQIYTYKVREDADPERVLILRKNIRRKLLLLFTFIRHEVRESNFGFIPGHLDGYSFEDNWYRDPCIPRVANLMSEEEKDLYDAVPVCNRASYVGAELSVLGNELASLFKNAGFFTLSFRDSLSKIFEQYDANIVIAETVIPDNFHHLLYLMTFCVCQFTPWMYLDAMTRKYPHENWGLIIGWFGGIVVCSAYYGVLVIASKLHNPFGFDFVDLDLECYGMRVHNEGLRISKASASQDLANYLDPPT